MRNCLGWRPVKHHKSSHGNTAAYRDQLQEPPLVPACSVRATACTVISAFDKALSSQCTQRSLVFSCFVFSTENNRGYGYQVNAWCSFSATCSVCWSSSYTSKPPGVLIGLSMQASRPACKASLPARYVVPVAHTVHSTAEASTTAARTLFQFAPRCKQMRIKHITSSLEGTNAAECDSELNSSKDPAHRRVVVCRLPVQQARNQTLLDHWAAVIGS
jgi:hypothetical protein